MVISAVVPTLDEARHLPTLLATLGGCEVVVSDGGSRDQTVALARAAGARVVEGSPGRGAQLARGAAVCQGERLWFLHADALPGAGALRALDAAPGPWGCFRIRLEPDDPWLTLTAAGMNTRARLTGSATGDMGVWMDRGFYEELGGFPDLASFEDLVLTDRARARVAPTVIDVPLVVSARRWLARGRLRTTLEHWALRAAYRSGVPPERLAHRYR